MKPPLFLQQSARESFPGFHNPHSCLSQCVCVDCSLESSYRDNTSGLDQAQVGLHTAAHNKTQPINEREAEEMEKWLKAQEEQNSQSH